MKFFLSIKILNTTISALFLLPHQKKEAIIGTIAIGCHGHGFPLVGDPLRAISKSLLPPKELKLDGGL